jgi:RHS repeat-associated protein
MFGLYPFGMTMPGRKYSAGGSYRYGFNGQEKSTELGEDSYTAEYWEYDARIGRRWNVDPVFKEYESPYAAFSGNPILNTDVNGDDAEGSDDPPGVWGRFMNWLFGSEKKEISEGVDNINEGASKQVVGPWNAAEIANSDDPDATIAYRKADGLTQALGGVGQVSEGIYTGGAKAEAIVEAPLLIKGGIQLLKGKSSQTLLKTLANEDVQEILRIKKFLDEPIPVSNPKKITGYTRHGLNQAIGREGGKGVNMRAMLDAVENPKSVTPGNSDGATVYKGKKAKVVLNKDGKVITTAGTSRGPRQRSYGNPNRSSGSGSAQRKANSKGFSYYPKSIH